MRTQRIQIARALRAAAAALEAKASLDWTAETATEYHKQHSRCPHGWHFDVATQKCSEVREPQRFDPEAYAKDTETHWDGWYGTLTDDEKNVLHDYTANGFEDLNQYLREGSLGDDEADAKQKQVTRTLKDALKKARMPAAAKVFRGTVNPSLHEMWFDSNLEPGTEIFANQFWSTSINPKEAVDFAGGERYVENKVRLTINVPKGAQAAYIDSYSANSGEYEVLLQHESILKVRKVTKAKDGALEIELDYDTP